MSFEATFVTAYGALLLLLAVGLFRLGRVSTSPWTGRVLAAYRSQAPQPPERAGHADWPHSEVPALHTALAAVASAAAATLAAAELVRNHAWPEVLVLGALAAAAASLTVGWLRRLR